VVLFLFVFAEARLYGAAALQVVYVVLSVYGWHQWLRGGTGKGELSVSRTPAPWARGLAVAGVLGTIALGLVLRYRTDAALPFPDAGTTAWSLVAQWMATRKWLESWLVWIAVDVVYVAMYASQRLYAAAGLYAAFLVLAFVGYREWRASWRARVVAP
jgi:nicotinamide mononucleotide transporter